MSRADLPLSLSILALAAAVAFHATSPAQAADGVPPTAVCDSFAGITATGLAKKSEAFMTAQLAQGRTQFAFQAPSIVCAW